MKAKNLDEIKAGMTILRVMASTRQYTDLWNLIIEGEEDVEEENLEFDEEEDITESPKDVGTDNGDDGNIPEAGERFNVLICLLKPIGFELLK